MTRYLLVAMILPLVGCSSGSSSGRRHGFAIVNSTEKDLQDVEVVSGNPEKDYEVYRFKTGSLAPGGFFRIYPDNKKLLKRSTISWKQDGTPYEQVVNTEVPSGFKGWMSIEFTDDGVQVARRPLSPPPGN